MSFTSWAFVAFVLGTLLAYYILPKRLQWRILLLASYGFYLSGGTRTVWYLLFTTLSVYLAGRLLDALNRRRVAADRAEKERLTRKKKLVVLAALLANFGLLYVLKYWSFTVEQLQPLFGGKLRSADFVLPLGVSFYTFQAVGYVIDCYRGKYPAERNPARLALFTSFFPQMVQGPISRYGELGPQLMAQHDFDATEVKYGIQLVLWGYFKKLVIAERAGVVVSEIFDHYTSYGGAMLAVGVLFYCIQLYCDFSGGIDITRGVAELFGIHLAENFRRPIYATSLADYWRRWHITLGQWMRDYLFYPLSLSKPLGRLGKWSRRKIGGKLGKVIPTSIATFVVYFVIGVWHGANFRYLVFGLWNGTIITTSFLLEGRFQALCARAHIAREGKFWHGVRLIRTNVLVFFGRYLTRAPRLMAALWMMVQLVRNPQLSNLWDGTILTLGLTGKDLVIVLLGQFAVLVLEFFQERGVKIRAALEQRHWLIQWAAILVLLVVILLLGIMRGSYIASAFIYQQF